MHMEWMRLHSLVCNCPYFNIVQWNMIINSVYVEKQAIKIKRTPAGSSLNAQRRLPREQGLCI